jgi:hypothetical protein
MLPKCQTLSRATETAIVQKELTFGKGEGWDKHNSYQPRENNNPSRAVTYLSQLGRLLFDMLYKQSQSKILFIYRF